MEGHSPVDDMAERLPDVLGKPSTHPAVVELMTSIGYPPLPMFPNKVEKVAPRHYADRPHGLDFIFHDAYTVEHYTAALLPQGTPLLVGVTFYAARGNTDGFWGFTGALPYEIQWSDSPEQLLERFGKPRATIQPERQPLRAHRWRLPDEFFLVVAYAPDRAILRVSVALI
jgi:hypothetical protein